MSHGDSLGYVQCLPWAKRAINNIGVEHVHDFPGKNARQSWWVLHIYGPC